MTTRKLETPSKSFVAPAGSGVVSYSEIDSTDHIYYGIECKLCGRRLLTGKVIAWIRPVFRAERLAFCTDCLQIVVDEAPTAAKSQAAKMKKITEKSTLVGWINEQDSSMEPV